MQTLTKAGGDDRGTDPRLVKLQDGLIATKGDKLVAPPQISKHGNDVVYSVIATTAPSAPATADLVRHLRSTVIPDNTSKGVAAFVGGSTAANVDLAAEISNRLPLVIITILLLSMLVLLVAFRSVLIPIQAAITNFLAAMAAFGIVTAVFQWGWGIDLVRIDTDLSTVPIASYVPLMMFAVLFGLSMDYQVFLLSSVDHHRANGETDRASVRLGLKSSARVISAAALIMISVFSSFILNGDPVVKQFGVGLASAVFLAATLVLHARARDADPAGAPSMVDARLPGHDHSRHRHRRHEPERPARRRCGRGGGDRVGARAAATGAVRAHPRTGRPPEIVSAARPAERDVVKGIRCRQARGRRDAGHSADPDIGGRSFTSPRDPSGGGAGPARRRDVITRRSR